MTEEHTISLVFEGDAQKTLCRMALEAHPLKTGGILVGHYTAGNTCACVTEILPPPPDSRSNRAEFKRGTEGLAEALQERWNAKERTYYLGEWHSRPCLTGIVEKLNVEPSAVDIESMIDLANDKATACPQPMLVIVGVWTGGKGMSMTNMGAFGFDRGSSDFIRLIGIKTN